MRESLLGRLIGLVILATAGVAAGLIWYGVSAGGPQPLSPTETSVVIGSWNVLYDSHPPSTETIAIAAGLALLLAAGVAALERKSANKSRRSADRIETPLAPKIVMAETRGVFDGEVTITVLIPAHNEEHSLPATIGSLKQQSHTPDRIIVVADNCSDGTVGVAQNAGVEVFVTQGNTKKKAGALNQALSEVLSGLGNNDILMVMDADTILDDGFLAAAVHRFESDRALMAIGGLFYGEEGHGLLGQLQRNEYLRYGREIRRRRGRVFVLTGTASLFRPRALREVAANRGDAIPGIAGDVYDTLALTEDNELTIALKSLGALMISPAECRVVTELMPTLRTLWRQRLRWQRGALENIAAYGLTGATFRYWAQQVGIGYSVIALNAFALLMILTATSLDQWIWFPFWLGLGSIFLAERVITVWGGGWRARLVAAALLPELLFDMYLNLVYVKGIFDITFASQATWSHLPSPANIVPEPIESQP